MKPVLCPRCKSPTLVSIGDGYYRCDSCGYTGKSTFDEELFKKGEK